MSDLCRDCGEYIGQNEENSPYCKCDRNVINELLDKIKVQEKQIARELADNNGLRAVIGIQDNALKEIHKASQADDPYFEIKKILKKKSEAILKL